MKSNTSVCTIQVMIGIVTQIVNGSLSSGIFPLELRTALVNPLIKRASLDPTHYKNYRPVSNIPYLSKVIEKIVSHRLLSYLSKHNLLEEYQSAQKTHHSAETALFEAQNHPLFAMAKGQGVF